MFHHESIWHKELDSKQRAGLLRGLHHEAHLAESAAYLDFSTNDYLHLSHHPQVCESALRAVEQHGVGRCSSRLISGGSDLVDTLEAELASWYGKESALIFPSGYQANVAALSTVLNARSLVIADKYIHRSLIDGIKLSGAKLLRYPHGDLATMKKMLEARPVDIPTVCVTESIFSMHGTVADTDAFCAIAKQYGALSCIDDAHGFGVMRRDENARLSRCDIVTTTLSKALGVQGGAIIGSATCIQYLVNFASGFIYTTALCPAVIGGALAALRLLPSLERERQLLWSLSDRFATWRGQMLSATHIHPVFFSSIEKGCQAQQILRQQGITSVIIRPPTVPSDQTLLRFSLTSHHSHHSLDLLFSALSEALCL